MQASRGVVDPRTSAAVSFFPKWNRDWRRWSRIEAGPPTAAGRSRIGKGLVALRRPSSRSTRRFGGDRLMRGQPKLQARLESADEVLLPVTMLGALYAGFEGIIRHGEQTDPSGWPASASLRGLRAAGSHRRARMTVPAARPSAAGRRSPANARRPAAFETAAHRRRSRRATERHSFRHAGVSKSLTRSAGKTKVIRAASAGIPAAGPVPRRRRRQRPPRDAAARPDR